MAHATGARQTYTGYMSPKPPLTGARDGTISKTHQNTKISNQALSCVRVASQSPTPWQQRIALSSNGDLFKCIASGKASVVTDEIEKFTNNGILLKSGSELKADVVATATGFNMNILGDIKFKI